MSAPLYIALLHYPVYNRNGEVVVTSVANFDIHDVARCARTYGVKAYYIINPVESQRYLAQRIMAHWQSGPGAEYNKSRKEAFSIVRFADSLEDTCGAIEAVEGKAPELMITDAKKWSDNTSYQEARELLSDEEQPYLLLFGTGWGLTKEIIERADYKLSPILGQDEYNHLSVRSALAIILDRLIGVDR